MHATYVTDTPYYDSRKFSRESFRLMVVDTQSGLINSRDNIRNNRNKKCKDGMDK